VAAGARLSRPARLPLLPAPQPGYPLL
jgi:hypothetical protein